VRVHLLGTGAAANECRYQASLLVQSEDGSSQLLLDTGNGLDVVRRLTGAGLDPGQIEHVFVSHCHVDHAGGLEPLLLWRVFHDQGEPRVCVLAEAGVIAALQQLFEAVSTVVPRLYGERLQWRELVPDSSVQLNDNLRLLPFAVDHEPPGGGALGCVVDLDGMRIAYSGDTRPGAALAEAASGVEVLFHEAGGLEADAEFIHMVGHSTAADAGRAAAAAGAQRLVLTHFPSEQLIEPMLAEVRRSYDGPIEMALDGARVEV